MSKLMPRMFPS